MQALGRCGTDTKPVNDPTSQLTRILSIPQEACLAICVTSRKRRNATSCLASLFRADHESIRSKSCHAWVHGFAFAALLASTEEPQTS